MRPLTEASLSRHAVTNMKKRGGLAVKLASPSLQGLPDLLVLWPNGAVHFVELKTETGRLSAVQNAVHARLFAMHCPVFTLHGKAAVDAYFRAWETTLC